MCNFKDFVPRREENPHGFFLKLLIHSFKSVRAWSASFLVLQQRSLAERRLLLTRVEGFRAPFAPFSPQRELRIITAAYPVATPESNRNPSAYAARTVDIIHVCMCLCLCVSARQRMRISVQSERARES